MPNTKTNRFKSALAIETNVQKTHPIHILPNTTISCSRDSLHLQGKTVQIWCIFDILDDYDDTHCSKRVGYVKAKHKLF